MYLHNFRYENVVKEEEDDESDEDDDTGPPFKSGTGPTKKNCRKWEQEQIRITFDKLTEEQLIEGKRYGCSMLCVATKMKKNKEKCMTKFKDTFCNGKQPECGSLSCGFGHKKNKCDV